MSTIKDRIVNGDDTIARNVWNICIFPTKWNHLLTIDINEFRKEYKHVIWLYSVKLNPQLKYGCVFYKDTLYIHDTRYFDMNANFAPLPVRIHSLFSYISESTFSFDNIRALSIRQFPFETSRTWQT